MQKQSNTSKSGRFSNTLHTTLMPSMSSGGNIFICDVPFKVCSDSDIPVEHKHKYGEQEAFVNELNVNISWLESSAPIINHS